MTTPSLEHLVGWFGPAGAAFAVCAFVIGFFYRRDVLRKVNDRKDLITAFSQSAAAQVGLAAALDAFSRQLVKHEAEEVELLKGIGDKIEHGLNAGFHSVLLELRAERR